MTFYPYLTTALLAALLLADRPAYADGEKILDVVVRGNRRVEGAAILGATTIKPGDILDSDRTDADVRSIYRLGQFQEVQVSSEPGNGGVVLVYAVIEKPVVRDIRFEGNKELKQDKLLEGLPVRRNAIFSQKDLDKAVAKLKKQYQDEGYFLVVVEPLIEQRSPTEYQVLFKVTEGKKIRISAINFEGNSAFSPRKLRGVMETKQEWFMSWLTGAGTYKEEVLKNDALLIADHYMNNGYINVKVGEPVMKLAEDQESLLVDISITEGDQYRVGEIAFKGDILYPEHEIRKQLKTESGEVFSRANLRADIGTLTDMTADKGYAFNNVNPQTKPDPGRKTMDLTFDVEKGDLVYIERISIAGNSKTRDKVARRELRLMEGDLYSATGFKRSKQNLMNTGYFEEANVATSKGSSGNKLNVNVDLKEKATGAFTIGGGYSSLDGLIFQGSVSQANFLGLGLKANASAAIGGKSNTYSIGLTDPYFLDTKWTLGVDIYRSERDYTDYSRRLTGGDIKAGYPITDFIGTFWMYKYEIKDIYDPDIYYLDANAKYPDSYPLGQTTTSSVYASLTNNTTDFRFDPSSGWVNTLSVEYAGLGGDNKYVREIFDNTYYHPLWWKFVISGKVVVGAVQKAGGPIPIDEKFYLGGIGTLRGYSARTVSPKNNDVYVGGEKELFGNIEIKFPLLPEYGIKGVGFFDYGNAWSGSFKPPKMLMSYGGGIRWASPMGPLRLEYGIPINPRPEDSKSGRFEFAIGSLF
ncbi:outer membrane protein assembly factor BamA [Trichlorobacter lovleyi]|uniref:Outer membrane protein assembly factor BamA n=1 Tax=Trichlorobacter lovleyi (strain ATCC BAA-1151 / DSM 17278 / SZ) TaxID=398767 RepID=B3E4H1_TRIL1|nr:outer membrane protein assembly factor BamA [Trichlorobacter lovleyi]ACD94486.1 outer membrane protein assembly complex, YaeT protein [Trichlorobacter lovleyi SZ]